MTTLKTKLVFVHGFLGQVDKTFSDFPARIKNYFDGRVEVLKFNYDSQGSDKVETLVNYILQECSSSPYILLGHSMGGILSVDAARNLYHLDCPTPKLILAYDTPFFGLSPNVLLESGATRLTGYAESFTNVVNTVMGKRSLSTPIQTQRGSDATTSASNSKSLWAGLAVGLATAAYTGYCAYSSLDSQTQQQVKDVASRQVQKVGKHVEFLGPLWNVTGMKERFQEIQLLQMKRGMNFHCFYALLNSEKTFIQLSQDYRQYFTPLHYTGQRDEIDVHMNMFDKSCNGLWEKSIALLRINIQE